MAKKRVEIEELDEDYQVIVGLDIGTTKIATIIGHKTPDGRLEIIGYGKGDSSGIEVGTIQNLTKTTQGINISKNYAIDKAGLTNIDKAIVGVAARHIKSIERRYEIIRPNGNEIIEQREIDEMCQRLLETTGEPGQKVLTVIPQDFIVDKKDRTTDPVGCIGESLEGNFQIIYGDEREVNKIIRCVKDAQIETETIILEPIASGLSCLNQTQKEEGVLLLDIGGGTSDMVIFYEGNPVFTKVIPIGGKTITRDIATTCNISYEMAETLKTQCGTCIVEKSNKDHHINFPVSGGDSRQISEPYLAEIIFCRINQMLQFVQQTLQKSKYANIVKSVVITGGGAQLKHLEELCRYVFGKPTSVGYPDVGFGKNFPSELRNPIYATGIGLLKYGFENLYTDDLEEEEPEENGDGFKEKVKSIFGKHPKGNKKASAQKWWENFLGDTTA